ELSLKIREAEASDGIWPILPYIVNTKDLSKTFASNRTCEFESQKKKNQKVEEKTSSRMCLSITIGFFIVQVEKNMSDFDLCSLSEQSVLQESNEPTDLDLTLINEVAHIVFVKRTANESEGAVVTELKQTGGTDSEICTLSSSGLENSKGFEYSRSTGTNTSLSCCQSTNVEVITLTDDDDEDHKTVDSSCEINESNIVLLDEVTNCSKLVTSESSTAHCSSFFSGPVQEMPSYTYNFCFLRNFFRCMSALPLNEEAIIRCLPRADEATVFNDLLSKQTAKDFGHLIRRWEKIKLNDDEKVWFRVCSYNILCQDVMEKTGFLYKHLRNCTASWVTRSKLLTKEFAMIDADILCLQEVQNLRYIDFYQPFFEAMGYKGVYKKKTGDLVDGCAIFYRNRFQLLSNTSIEYFVGKRTILDRDNVGQLVRLRDTKTDKEFCVANTHLLFNAKRGDIKLAQLAILLAHLDKCCGPLSLKPCPYILCGDFNISPFCAVYNFLLENRLCFTNLSRNDMSGQGFHGGPPVNCDLMPVEANINRNCQFGEDTKSSKEKNEWTHSLNFASVYHHFDSFNEPEVSSFTSEEAVNPDLMLYSVFQKASEEDKTTGNQKVCIYENSLKLLRRLSLPNEKILKATLGPWPNKGTPSDHIPLIADFSLE
uniref:Endo/exonuclease/phosphatase domain-containing protein n=1 Tax=Syphacia muris TaxID=451379 RepID=A0A158R4G1_9BILA